MEPAKPATKIDDSTLIMRGPGKKKRKGGGEKGVHFDPYKLPDKVDFTRIFK